MVRNKIVSRNFSQKPKIESISADFYLADKVMFIFFYIHPRTQLTTYFFFLSFSTKSSSTNTTVSTIGWLQRRGYEKSTSPFQHTSMASTIQSTEPSVHTRTVCTFYLMTLWRIRGVQDLLVILSTKLKGGWSMKRRTEVTIIKFFYQILMLLCIIIMSWEARLASSRIRDFFIFG